MERVKLALVQMSVTADKEANLRRGELLVRRAASYGAEIVCLPEMWNTPYSNACFPEYAEPADGITVGRMSALAAELGITLVGGSIPEREGERLYNTSFAFGPDGALLGRHRKMHLFDIDITGGVRFKESDTLSPGDAVTVFQTPKVKVGVAICFDMRFPELMRLMTDAGAELILVPAAFNMTTGPAHWHLTARLRAVDNQVYFGCVSPARDEAGPYIAYGHTLLSDPWGRIQCEAEEEETILVTELEPEPLERLRKELPLLAARRGDVYELRMK